MTSARDVVVLLGLATCAPPAPARSPHRARPREVAGPDDITVAYRYTSFHARPLDYVLHRQPDGSFRFDGRVVPDDAIARLRAAAHEDLQPSSELQTCTSHTDDYPAFHVVIPDDPPIELWSDSNCRQGIPWNVVRDHVLAVQYDGAAGRAIAALLRAIDPDEWSRGIPDGPDATVVGPGPVSIGLGVYPVRLPMLPDGVRAAASRTPAFAHALQASPLLGRLVRDPVVVALRLTCIPARSPECHDLDADEIDVRRSDGIVLHRLEAEFVDAEVTALSVSAADIAGLDAFLAAPTGRAVLAAAPADARITAELQRDHWELDVEDASSRDLGTVVVVPAIHAARLWPGVTTARALAALHVSAAPDKPVLVDDAGHAIADDKR